MEILDGPFFGTCPLLILLGQHSKSASLLDAIGFTWDTDGFERFNIFSAAVPAIFPVANHESDLAYARLLISVSSPDEAIDESELNAWIPSPAALAEMETAYMKIMLLADMN